MIAITQDVQDYNFSSALGRLSFTTNKSYADFSLKCGDDTIFSERFVPGNGGSIDVLELDKLVLPYLTTNLIESFSYSINDGDTTVNKSFSVQYCKAEVFYNAGTFNLKFFLNTAMGDKDTAPEHIEYLYMVLDASTDIIVDCSYWDGNKISTKKVNLGSFSTLNKVLSVIVSPSLFEDSTLGNLINYTVTAGERSQTFNVGKQMDASPIILFTNSFGCQETFYCEGTLSLEPEMTRNTDFEKGMFRNYQIEENRVFKANTGPLSPAMMNMADDMLRSAELYLFSSAGLVGKEVTITDSKQARKNDLDDYPSFTFEYRYAQRNHNIIEIPRAGRIFDFTYDNTFE